MQRDAKNWIFLIRNSVQEKKKRRFNSVVISKIPGTVHTDDLLPPRQQCLARHSHHLCDRSHWYNLQLLPYTQFDFFFMFF